jgi:hypothetical protein
MAQPLNGRYVVSGVGGERVEALVSAKGVRPQMLISDIQMLIPQQKRPFIL